MVTHLARNCCELGDTRPGATTEPRPCRAAYDRWSARADEDLTFYLGAAIAALSAGFEPGALKATLLA